MKLTHPDNDPKSKPIEVNDDTAEAYISQGWVPVDASSSK